MKDKSFSLVLLCIVLFAFLLCHIFVGCGENRTAELQVHSEGVAIFSVQDNSPCFRRISDVGTWLGVYEGKLYIVRNVLPASPKTDYDGWLCVFDGNELKRLCRLGDRNAILTGYTDGFLYYCVQQDGIDELFCYDFYAKEEVHLSCPSEPEPRRAAFYSRDGSLLIPAKKISNTALPDSYIRVSGRIIDNQLWDPPALKCGTCCYELFSDYSNISSRVIGESIVEKKENGECCMSELSGVDITGVYESPCGLLIHDRSGNEMLLQLLNKTVTPLFFAPCKSSINSVVLQEENVFLSFKRFEKLDDAWGYFATRYDNDNLEGTYRISLTDGCAEKLSDNIYRDLYCFDGTHLFACDDNGNVYILDLKGIELKTILTVD